MAEPAPFPIPELANIVGLATLRLMSGGLADSSAESPEAAMTWELTSLEPDSCTIAEQDARVKISSIQEISSQRRLEEINSFRKFAIEAAEIGIWEWNASSGEASYIENCLELIGLGSATLRAQLRGISREEWAARIHPDDVLAHNELFEKHLRGHSGLLDIDHRMLHADGTYRWFNTHGKVVEWDDTGCALRMAGIFRDIHQVKMVELRSQENESRFRGAFENTPIGFAIIGGDAVCLDANTALCEMLGYERGELIGKPFSALTPLSDPYREPEAIKSLIEMGAGRATFVRPYLCRNGKAILTKNHVVVVDSKGLGIPPQSFILIEDITEQEQTKAALNQSERLFREAFEFGPVGATILNSDARYLQVNEAFARMLGYQRPELVGRYNRDITVPGDKSADLSAMFQLLEEGVGRTSLVKQYIHRDGSTIDARLEISVISGDIRQPDENLRFLAFAQDLTELRKTQEALQTSEMRSNLAVESAGIGVWEWDARRDFGFYSQRTCEILDVTPMEIATEEAWLALIHPDDRPDYVKSRQAHLEGRAPRHKGEVRILQKNGSYKWIDDHGKVVERDDWGRPLRMVGTLRDITELVEQRQKIQNLAFSDPLTMLPNRALFNSQCESVLERSRDIKAMFALMILDLDNFKDVNDTLGHAAGDQLLCEASTRLSARLRAGDMLARLGGDEFAVILHDPMDRSVITDVATRLLAALSSPFRIDGQDLFVSASLGIAVYPEHGFEADNLFACADMALYEAKGRGRNNFQFYDKALSEKSELKLKLGNALRTVCANDELELMYQPKVELDTGRIIGAEALLRWRHPELGLLMPNSFIALAEDNGTIVDIGRWVIRNAARAVAVWNKEHHGVLKVAVNLSARQFLQNDLATHVREVLEESGCEAAWFECEITESLLLKDEPCVQETLAALHATGVSIAIDDFGTGHSALAYLTRFPIDVLKIDRSFINGIESDARGTELVKAFILIAKALGMETVAEGVETGHQADVLRALGCGIGQGYLFCRPISMKDFTDLVANSKVHAL